MWKLELIGSILPHFPVLCQYPLYHDALGSYLAGLPFKPILFPENSKHITRVHDTLNGQYGLVKRASSLDRNSLGVESRLCAF